MNPKVEIITVKYNGGDSVLELLESLLHSSYDNWSVTVVDNGSTDGSWVRVKRWINNDYTPVIESADKRIISCIRPFTQDFALKQKRVSLVDSTNTGFAGGCNVGLKYIDNDTDFVWFLNPDTVVTTSALTTLIQTFEAYQTTHDKVGVLGAKLLNYYKPNTIHSIYKKFINGGTAHVPDNVMDNGKTYTTPDSDVDYVTGSSLFVPASVIQEAGKMDEDYFLNYEEIDWLERIKNAGYSIRTCETALVYHKVSETFTNYMMGYYLARNQLFWLSHWHPEWVVRVKKSLKYNWQNVKRLLRGNSEYLRGMWQGVRDFELGKREKH